MIVAHVFGCCLILLLRILSSEKSSLVETLTVLLNPVLEAAAMAGERPYLSREAVRSSLEMLTTLAKVIVQGREDREEGKGHICQMKNEAVLITALP